MKIDKMFRLKIGDKVVRVRNHYQNYDNTKIPCEPKIYTVCWRGCGQIDLKEYVKTPFYHTVDKVVYDGNAGGIDNRAICDYYETYEDYITGNYKQGIILDTQRYKSIEDFLEEKRVKDYERAKEKRDTLYKELQEKYLTKEQNG